MTMTIASICRFYGWSWRSVLEMDTPDFIEALKGMEALSSIETLKQLKIQDWPTMKPSDRKDFHKEISKKANLKKKIITMDEIDNFFGML